MRRPHHEPHHLKEAREEIVRQEEEAREFLNRPRVNGARVLRSIHEPPSPELEPVEEVLARYKQEHDQTVNSEIYKSVLEFLEAERKLAEEVATIEANRPLGAPRPRDEPRSIHLEPPILPWKRKLRP